MRDYLFKILITIFGLLVINISLFLVVYKYYYQPYENMPISDKDEVFILADSHGSPLKQNLRNRGVYNFSIGSDSYFDIYRKALYLSKKTNVKKIIITADNHTLSKYREKLNNKDRSIIFLDYDDKDFFISDKFSFFKEKYIKRYIPLLNSKTTGLIQRYFESLFKKKTTKIYNWKTTKNKKKKCVSRVKSQFRENVSSDKLKKCIKKIVELCKQNNIKIFAIKFPLTSDFLLEISDRNYGADKYFEKLGIKTYDFSELYIEHDEYFSNQDHLNNLGGELFAKELLKIIE